MLQLIRDDNMFERFELLVGNKIKDIKDKRVLVIGIGGVGSYTVETLVRSGITNITIVDNDKIDISNLNRQLMSTKDNIGMLKVDVMKDRILSINENCNIDVKNIFVDSSNVSSLINDYDYVVDACDNINSKISIINECNLKKIKLICAMGTGNKQDPTKLEITDINKTAYDPLAKIIRKKVRDMGIKKLTVVSSTERPIKKNISVIPSNSYVPSVAGILITSYIINDIVGDLHV